MLLGHAHPRRLLRRVAHFLNLVNLEIEPEVFERRHHSLGRPGRVHLGGLVALHHLEVVPFEGAREVARHELHHRLERHQLLPHLRRDDSVHASVACSAHQRLTVAPRCTHHKRHLVLGVELRHGIHSGWDGVINHEQARVVRERLLHHAVCLLRPKVVQRHRHAVHVQRLPTTSPSERDGDEGVASPRHDRLRCREAHIPRAAVHHDEELAVC
mmetsp:Transcript_18532/g.60363  ORF Transcript_18532/g.60363 Transcript_18532/m.60363 type:complete len:214 (+) Transcript_18532:1260-1901(+)